MLKDLEEIGEDLDGIEKAKKKIKELEKLDKEIDEIENGINTVNLSLADKILGFISYKLKVGVDYEITPQIFGAVGITVGREIKWFKTTDKNARYNFRGKNSL
ncbi:MAG: hypothetical protein ACR5KX_01225 [Wolbachia sp.]